MNLKSYLKRINYHKDLVLNKALLFELQQCHLKNVPFENLDIHYNRVIELDLTAIYNKIVEHKRGGFCYELNGLFYSLLKEIGFDVWMVSGRVYNGKGGYGQEYDHLALMVALDGDHYLVDVGFGKFSSQPLRINFEEELLDDVGCFKFDRLDENYWRVNEVIEGELVPQYIFSPQKRALQEFQEMCTFHQSSPASHFTQKRVVSLPTKEGRITLNDQQFKITKQGVTETIAIKNEAQFEAVLMDQFAIKII
ncbi:arylamine N-acetyltransferase family protein [Aureispira anguillae]|uniref:Arylamine N-acetyltransferase n=1 Tax=Aureispira anguillae TaxID=2864201 RepID=A0A915YC10_9BACT|nr:arylamine N-acetyltransferase [Aureispira anguillae]BDS10279.1 arylamine N-acetyltransferase [Aureispira anguillae]